MQLTEKQKPPTLFSQLKHSFYIAFSMYSKIPVPSFDWKKSNMAYVMCFFPLVGVMISIVSILWILLAVWGNFVDKELFLIILLVLPVVITGGIHLDGFIDTQDALSSYQEKERRLEILKDPRVGAFGVIATIMYYLLSYAGIELLFGSKSQINSSALVAYSMIFILSRALSGLAIVTFPLAKDTGLAYLFSSTAQKKTVKYTMVGYLLCCVVLLFKEAPLIGVGMLVGVSLFFFFYHQMAKKQFGGITGDLAGWFLQLAELVMLFAVGMMNYFW